MKSFWGTHCIWVCIILVCFHVNILNFHGLKNSVWWISLLCLFFAQLKESKNFWGQSFPFQSFCVSQLHYHSTFFEKQSLIFKSKVWPMCSYPNYWLLPAGIFIGHLNTKFKYIWLWVETGRKEVLHRKKSELSMTINCWVLSGRNGVKGKDWKFDTKEHIFIILKKGTLLWTAHFKIGR